MENGRLNKNHAPAVYVYLIALVTVGLPLSRFVMSISQILLLVYWLFTGFSYQNFFKGFKKNIITKIKAFYNNKPAVVFASIYFMHLAGLIYTTDFHYAAKDLRVKLPILIFPLVFASMPKLSFKQFKKILLIFVAAVTAGITLSFIKYLNENYIDVRELSPFLSPIRFSLNILLGIVVLSYFILYDKTVSLSGKILSAILILIFLFFLIIIESITAVGTLLVIITTFLLFNLLRIKYLWLKITMVFIIIALPVALGIHIYNIVNKATTPPNINISKLDTLTANGNHYEHDMNYGLEDGKLVGIYLCKKELRKAWNKRSKLDYDGKALSGDNIDNIIIRYMTSKGLRKDSAGISALSDWDIRKIEEGVANINYVSHPGLKSRILKIILGYQRYIKTGDPSGNSVTQRYEYLKGSFLLIKEHPLWGVGTGDFENELFKEYKKMKSKLKKKYIFHPHNQFVSITITFGLLGLLWFIFSLIYPPLKLGFFNDYFFLAFFIMIILSMFSDDTMDTQAGATLFAFFYSFLLFTRKEKKSLYISL